MGKTMVLFRIVAAPVVRLATDPDAIYQHAGASRRRDGGCSDCRSSNCSRSDGRALGGSTRNARSTHGGSRPPHTGLSASDRI
jgi:hypothetical protein